MLILALIWTLIAIFVLKIESNTVENHSEYKISPIELILKNLHHEPPIKILPNQKDQNIKERWITQKLDNFQKADNRTWKMRYFVNEQNFIKDGPIFIYVGGEWEISEGYLGSGHIYDMAKQQGAIMYYTEHRYYGKSWPTNTTSTKDLQYLTSKQALADLAHFIKYQKSTVDALRTAAVILTGASYSASMVAWFTRLYPRMATACWASSAPLYAKMDFYEYMQQVGAAINRISGDKCTRRIRNGHAMMQKHLSNKSSTAKLLKRLKICENFDVTNTLDMASFFYIIANQYADIVQSDRKSIQPICDYLLEKTNQDDISAIIDLMRAIFWPSSEPSETWCMDFTYQSISRVFTKTTDYASNTRQWFYQTCNEFGWYSTTSNTFSPPQYQLFGNNVNVTYFQQLCAIAFGARYSISYILNQIAQTNLIYGGLLPPFENVFMTHGQLDPWRAAGRIRGRNVIVIPDYSHCEDLTSINVNDSMAMNSAKMKVASFLSRRLRGSK